MLDIESKPDVGRNLESTAAPSINDGFGQRPDEAYLAAQTDKEDVSVPNSRDSGERYWRHVGRKRYLLHPKKNLHY